ncbi:hypothetical protein EJ04DRAFT_548380 [Polyplosphaeria fusca]|uniref:CFEM domain-containing protein n=1 Tax=Polyplosphaeria fusca TaxID=682080 RepID=A0A9P4RAJ0_9PLEO|nr:hypothetical protein EJ04DRAFT_548380 [Polyplosphaeria fusca]
MKKLALLLAAAALATAQSVIDYSKLPQCARGCTVLQQAESNCLPPAAPVSQQAIYQSCVCQSTLLTQLHASGSQCQQTGCSSDDAQKISQYYIALCNGPVVQPPATTTTATGTGTATTTSSTATGTANSEGAGGNKVATSQEKPSWFSSHWKWVVMVIVIALAIIIFWVGGVFIRRRFNRKKDAERANLAARDAPYTPSSKSVQPQGPTPPMTMSGGRSGMGMDGNVGGIAPPRRASRTRSRTNTLQSLGMNNESRTSIPQPVVWGPHQHLAHVRNGNGSPNGSVPPSPTFPQKNHVMRNPDAVRSEPRFANYSVPEDEPTSQGTPGHVNFQEDRPHTAIGGGMRDGPGRSLHSVRSDPVLPPHVEALSAEICEPSPIKSKPNKLHK